MKKQARDRKTYRTPKRECAHADKGCCPKCYDPCGLLKSTRERRKKNPKARAR